MEVWYQNPSVLFSTEHLLDFWPSTNATTEERINSTTRFIAYTSLLLFFSTRKSKFIAYGLFLVTMLAFIYYRTVDASIVHPSSADNVHTRDAVPTGVNTRVASSVESFTGFQGPPKQLYKRDYVKFARFLTKK